ncbi:MAG TPA: hypothetical protein VLN57_21280 [Xanthobacteraceae bacterium]|nr:hypothetical protein [Xanthobacteraceae bacterium]
MTDIPQVTVPVKVTPEIGHVHIAPINIDPSTIDGLVDGLTKAFAHANPTTTVVAPPAGHTFAQAGSVSKVTPPDPTPIKSGWLTTEFLGAWAAKIFGALLTSGVLADGSIAMRITGAAVFVLAQLGYTWSRTVVKTAAMLLLVGLFVPAQIACSGKGTAVLHAVVNCAETEGRAEAVKVLTPVVTSVIVSSTSADGKVIDTAPIKNALTKANVLSEAGTILSCATERAFALLAAPAPAPVPRAPASAALVVDPTAVIVARAQVMATIAPGVTFQVDLTP